MGKLFFLCHFVLRIELLHLVKCMTTMMKLLTVMVAAISAQASAMQACPRDWTAPAGFSKSNAFGFCWNPADPAAGRQRLVSNTQMGSDVQCPPNMPQKCKFAGTTWGNY